MLKIIKLNDGVEVEVEVQDNQGFEISNSNSIDSSIDRVQELLKKIIRPISETYEELNQDVTLESAKVAVGIKIGIEGNFILAKSNAEAHILVEMTLRPKHA